MRPDEACIYVPFLGISSDGGMIPHIVPPLTVAQMGKVQLQRAAKLCGDKVEFIYLDGRTPGTISKIEIMRKFAQNA